MLRTDEILSTIQMLHTESLDVRTVTLALHMDDCAAPNPDELCRKLRAKITSRAARLVETCNQIGRKYGIPIVNKRLAISPAANLLAGHDDATALAVARTLDDATAACGIDLIGGFTALVHKGITPSDLRVMQSLPQLLSQTKRVCASVNVATTRAGVNMDAIAAMGRIVLQIAAATAAIGDQDWLAETRAKLLATRGRLVAEMRKLGFVTADSQANFTWNTHPRLLAKPLYEQLKGERILVRYMNYPGWGDGLRISVGTDAEVDACLEKLKLMV